MIELARATAWFMEALAAVRQLGLGDWCIGAGAVRNLVWDALHERQVASMLADVDVVYFDASDCSPARDEALRQRLAAAVPSLEWEVTNQAGVHRWFEASFGYPVAPLASLEDGVASWPEFATAVGIALDRDGALRVIAPHGLDDLFNMVVRHNPARASVASYRERIASKRFAERWPRVTVIAC